MSNEVLAKNIEQYIIGSNENSNIDKFKISRFDYRKLFNKPPGEIVTHKELVYKFFCPTKTSNIDKAVRHCMTYWDNHEEKLKELLIFFAVMPFTEYEFCDSHGRVINPSTLTHLSSSKASDNILMQTFAEFDLLSNEILDSQFYRIFQDILLINIFSASFSQAQRENIIIKLFGIGFKQDYTLVSGLYKLPESGYKNNFMNYLYTPICHFVAALLGFEVNVQESNAEGYTGVHTEVPHQTNDIFCSYPDIVAYDKWGCCKSLSVVEVKKLPILINNEVIDFNSETMNGFFQHLVAEMFSNHTNKGILTDSYTIILVEIDIKGSLKHIETRDSESKKKSLALNFKVLNCHLSGLTLRLGLISFIHEAFSASEFQLNEIKRGLDAIFNYIRKTDEQYLSFLDEIARKEGPNYEAFCTEVIENYSHRAQPLLKTTISLGDFNEIDVQTGMTFNSQLFKVNIEDVRKYLKQTVQKDEKLIVKVFDPIKAKRDHDSYRISKGDIKKKCREAYLREMAAYEKLLPFQNFNSIYIDQKCVFGRFDIDVHYHALGPFLILKYIESEALPLNKETYEKAREQLNIVHSACIIHGDISLRNILYTRGKIYLIDFGYSKYADGDDDRPPSKPVPVTFDNIKNENETLSALFNQAHSEGI